MTIVFAGASNVLNAGLDSDQLGFSEQVAACFDQKLLKIAVAGASNSFLIRNIKEYIEHEEPDLLIVTWQTWEREEWLHEGVYYQINSSDCHLPKILQKLHKQWVASLPDDIKLLGQKWHDEVWQLHQQLKQKNIKHLFYNEMYPFTTTNKQIWHHNFINPYDNDSSFFWWLHNRGYSSDKTYHYNEQGHRAWATRLIDHIREHNIL
jgi:hypothetical protein